MKFIARAAVVLLVLTIPTLSNHAEGGHFTFEPADKLFTWAAAWLDHMPFGSLAHNSYYMQSELPGGFVDFFATIALFIAVPVCITAWLEMVGGMRSSIKEGNKVSLHISASGVCYLVLSEFFQMSNEMQGPITASTSGMLRGICFTLALLEVLAYVARQIRARWST